MTRLCVHKDEQRVCLLGAAAHDVLQGGDILEGVERHHPVIVVPCQQEHRGVLNPVTFWDADVMERGVPGKEEGEQWDGGGGGVQIEVEGNISNLYGGWGCK